MPVAGGSLDVSQRNAREYIKMTRTSLSILFGVVGIVYPAVQEIRPVVAAQTNSVAVNGAARTKLVGDTACLTCHKEQTLPYLHTSHHRTSQLANRDSVLGSFGEGSNI